MIVTLEVFQEEGQILFAAFIKSVVAVIQLGVCVYIYRYQCDDSSYTSKLTDWVTR